jgi:hypothetical protein
MKTSIFKYFRRVAILGNCRCSLRACKSGTTSGRIHLMSANKLSSPFLASQWYSEAGAVTEQATAAATCLGLLTRMRFCMLGCKFGANFFLWGGFLWTVHISLGSWREGFANHYYFEIEKVCFQKNWQEYFGDHYIFELVISAVPGANVSGIHQNQCRSRLGANTTGSPEGYEFAVAAESLTIAIPVQPTAMPAKSHRANNPKQFAAAFASTVTVHSSQDSDWIARKGSESIFALLKEVFPEVRESIKLYQSM